MKRVQDFKVKDYRWLNDTNYIINLQSDQAVADILPGNFAEVEIPNTSDVFLRRPFSVLDIDHDQNILSFYVKVIGKGTKKLGSLRAGDELSVIYPLGNSFEANEAKNIADELAHAIVKDPTHGIDVEYKDKEIHIDIYIIIEYGTRIKSVAASVANTVSYQVEKSLGIPVNEINIHVQGLRISNGEE